MSAWRAAADVARFEARRSARSRATLVVAIAFALLMVAVAFEGINVLSLALQRVTPATRRFPSPELVYVVGIFAPVVPLLAVADGASPRDAAGPLGALLAMPVPRASVAAGVVAGRALPLATAAMAGTLLGGAAAAPRSAVDAPALVAFALMVGLLFAVFAALGVALQCALRSPRAAATLGLGLWLAYEGAWGLVLLGEQRLGLPGLFDAANPGVLFLKASRGFVAGAAASGLVPALGLAAEAVVFAAFAALSMRRAEALR